MDRPYCKLLHPAAVPGGIDPGVEQDAEIASLENTPDAFKLYDVAVKYVKRSYEFPAAEHFKDYP